MSWLKTKRGRMLALVLLAAILAAVSPSFTYVRVKGNGQDVEVQRAGFGPQKIRVRTGDASVESSAR